MHRSSTIFSIRLFKFAVSLCLAMLGSAVHAEDADACGEKHHPGWQAMIYNESAFSWIVDIETTQHLWHFGNFNAGTVKYLAGDKWIDNGTGDHRYSKSHKIPIKPSSSVHIAYCPDTGTTLSGVHTQTKPSIVGYVHVLKQPEFEGPPMAGVVYFTGHDSAPEYTRRSDHSRRLFFDRDLQGNQQKGSIIICPNSVDCKNL